MMNVQQAIINQLHTIEKKYGVQVLFACESGSRAWGFASPDSDYDVRFIYAHSLDGYLSINVEDKRDVIELPIENDLDINGWDVRKALKLLRKSNPPLLEWLQSPIVYLDNDNFAVSMREMLPICYLPICYSPIGCAYHYRQMAKRNFNLFLGSEAINIKKYFYVLRPLLAVRWIEAERGPVPTEFIHLLNTEFPDGTLRDSIDALLEHKQNVGEAQSGPRVPVLHDWIETEMARLRTINFELSPAVGDAPELNALFREIVRRV